MKRLLSFSACAALLLGASLPGQTLNKDSFPRPLLKASASSLYGGNRKAGQAIGQGQLAAPKEVLKAAGPGLHDLPLLVYSAWVENFGGRRYIRFRRSVDGGYTWSPARTLVAEQSFENFYIGATLHQVYIAYCGGTNNSTGGAKQDIYVLASWDEGMNWTKPVMVNGPAFGGKTGGTGDADDLHMAVTTGKIHLVYEYALNNAGMEDIFYVGVQLKGKTLTAFHKERRVNVGNKPYTVDVDFPTIAADGPIVAIAWCDDRVGGQNNLYCAVSNGFGMNFGTVKGVQVTNFTKQNPRKNLFRWDTALGVGNGKIYLAWSNNYASNTVLRDEVMFSASYDLGKTFAKPVKVNRGAPTQTTDSDQITMSVDGDTVVVCWHDDRDGVNNYGNAAYVMVDTNGGKDILAGKAPEIRIDGSKPLQFRTSLPYASVRGNRIVVVYHKAQYVQNSYRAEDVVYRVSNDKGKTWSAPRFGTDIASLSGGTQDVDIPICLLTTGGDCVCLWADDRASANDLYLSGFRAPTLRQQSGSSGWVVENFPPSRNGELGLLLFTDFGTTPDPIFMALAGGKVGYAPNFRILQGGKVSLVTTLMIGLPGVLTTVQNGAARFNIPKGFGIWHVIGLGIDPKSQSLTWYTDPMKF